MNFDDELMLFAYVALIPATIFLIRGAPDEWQRYAMIFFVAAFAIGAVTLLLASFNGSDEILKMLLRDLRRTGREFQQTGVFIFLGRLMWHRWVRGPLPPPLR